VAGGEINGLSAQVHDTGAKRNPRKRSDWRRTSYEANVEIKKVHYII